MRALPSASLSLLLLLAACGGPDGGDRVGAPEVVRPTSTDAGTPTPTRSPSANPSASPSAGPSASPSPSFPPQAPAEHGGKPTAVYLALAYDIDAPELERARRRAAQAGYRAGGGDISCDQGAREALGLDPDRSYWSVALYFPDRATAQQFVDAYEPGVVGMAEVTTYCLD